MPSWDNTARRMTRAHIYADHSAVLFAIWLNNSVREELHRQRKEQLRLHQRMERVGKRASLFEPDARNGLARLDALKFVVDGGARPDFALELLTQLAKNTNGDISNVLSRALSC